ncbi:molecular chaperone MKKS-like [Saccoglossus kowalevskii]|uniref:McKusick-Kaufman/Bardet-Biedl syndromes putative chaperonin-like n=1 Tax=Saccoglossus kowalevskii TaxID=10224 RepID=A0ABM0M0S4_SACKO|nr:PREDICTED: mcKusick-Kaufman/Bardet-Biedl syndromes putative chaperonin-like [Saccoglossus kowalevskii]
MNQLPENASSGIAVSPSQQSIVKVQSLEDPEILHSINLFKDILLSCYGPHGQIKIIQNNSGGQVTMTSLSSTLFHCISLSSPVLSLVKAAVQNHLSRFSDGGLLTAILSMSLISKCLESKVPRLICTNVNEYILKQIEDYLQVSECECKVQIDFTSVPTMMKIIRSVIASKPACCLLSNETNLVSSLVLQAYLQTLSMNDVGGSTARLGRVEYVIVDGPPVSDSQLFPGVLFEAPHLPTYRTSINKSKRVEAGLEKGLIKVVLYNTSMSGDSEELMDVRYEVTQDMVASEVVLQKLMQVSEYLVHHGVGLVACQKVIHPAIKKYFKQHNVLAIDRLSLTHIGAVQTLTGAKLLGTLHSAINAADFGYLTDVNHKVLFNKSYIHMESPSAAVVTIVICNRNEQALQELKCTKQFPD